MSALAKTLLVVNTLAILCAPFLIGKKREPLAPANLVFWMLLYAADVVVYGRVLGWW